MKPYDVLVAGAGPVGLAAAIEAAQRGLSVAVFDPRPGPVDKACGEGLMPGAVAALSRLGVAPSGMPFVGIAYVDSKHVARHDFSAGPGLGVRRTVLHSAMSARAAELGVELVETRVERVRPGPDVVEVDGRTGRWLLACDGLHSPIRRQLGLDPTPTRPAARRFGQRRHLAVPPWSDRVEVHWGPRAEVYVTPVAPDLVGVAVLSRERAPYDDLLAGVPSVLPHLDRSAWATPVRGAGPLRQSVRQRVGGRVLLVGDAAGYVDALTGEGIRTGLACARAAVDAVMAGDPAAYERDWRRLTRSYRILTSGLLVTTRPRPVRRHITAAAARLPAVYARAVESLAG